VLFFAEKSHQTHTCKGEGIIEDKGGRGKDIRGFHEVQKPVDKPHQKPVSRAIEIGVNEYGYKGCEGDRAAVLYGFKFDKRKHERACHANPRKSNAFGIITAVFRFTEKTDSGNDGKQGDTRADGNPFDNFRGLFADG
jgi:hypothetical protein